MSNKLNIKNHEVYDAVSKLSNAFANLMIIVDKTSPEQKKVLEKFYPFYKSLDDLNYEVDEWVNIIEEELEKIKED